MEEKKEFVVTAKRGEFKGSAILQLSTGETDRYPFVFGLTKAKRILACLPDIQSFVKDCEAKAKTEAKS